MHSPTLCARSAAETKNRNSSKQPPGTALPRLSPRSDVLLVTYPRFPNKEQVTMPPETPPQIVDVSAATGACGDQLARCCWGAGGARGRHSGVHNHQATCQAPQPRPILPAAGTNLGVEDARRASDSHPDPHLGAARPRSEPLATSRTSRLHMRTCCTKVPRLVRNMLASSAASPCLFAPLSACLSCH